MLDQHSADLSVLQPAKFEPSSSMKTSTTRTGFSSLT
jgi:hypothetical protein